MKRQTALRTLTLCPDINTLQTLTISDFQISPLTTMAAFGDRFLLLDDAEGTTYAHLGLKIVAKYSNNIIEKKGNFISVGNCSIPVSPYNEMFINFADPSGTFPIVSFYNILQMARQGNAEFFTKNFKDKIVLIGPGNIYSQDFKPTPYYASRYCTETRQTSGVEIDR